MCFCVWGRLVSGKEVLLGWVNMQVVDWRGRVQAGRLDAHLWPMPQGKSQLDDLSFMRNVSIFFLLLFL